MSTPKSRRTTSSLPFVLESQLETLSSTTKKLDAILRSDPSLYSAICSDSSQDPESQFKNTTKPTDFISLNSWDQSITSISSHSHHHASNSLSFDPESPLLDDTTESLSLDALDSRQSFPSTPNGNVKKMSKQFDQALALYNQRKTLLSNINSNVIKLEAMISEMSETILNSDPSHAKFMTQKLLVESYSDVLSSCKIQLKKCNEIWESTINYCKLFSTGNSDTLDHSRAERLFTERRLIDDTSSSLNTILETTSASRRQLLAQNATFDNISSRFTRISADLMPTIQRTMGNIRTRFQRNSLIMGALISTIIIIIIYQQT